MNSSYADLMQAAYPKNITPPALPFLGPDYTCPASPYGLLWQGVATYAGDATFTANRRLSCATWAAAGLDAYCYRFNAIQNGEGPFTGVTHASDVAFVFNDTLGVGEPEIGRALPFEGMNQSYYNLADLMNGGWISFVSVQNPNLWPGRECTQKALGVAAPPWPKYAAAATGVAPQIYVFNGNTSCVA